MKFNILIVCFLLLCSLCVKAEDISIDIGYPAVDEMEARVFGSVYSQENIYKRLDRLEMKVFGRVTKATLSDRVDVLRNAVNPNPIENRGGYITDFPPEEIYPAAQVPKTKEEQSIILYDLENELLGTVYITEPVETRIARLEKKVFNQSSENYPAQERLQRLCAYVDAKSSDQYYDDQSKLRKYANYANGAKAISILFMILQMFL